MTFFFSKVNFSLLEKKNLKKVEFFIIFVHMNVQNLWYILIVPELGRLPY